MRYLGAVEETVGKVTDYRKGEYGNQGEHRGVRYFCNQQAYDAFSLCVNETVYRKYMRLLALHKILFGRA